MRISDWSSDVCSSDLDVTSLSIKTLLLVAIIGSLICGKPYFLSKNINLFEYYSIVLLSVFSLLFLTSSTDLISIYLCLEMQRSEEHTSELQSLMRISYAVFCLKKKKLNIIKYTITTYIT